MSKTVLGVYNSKDELIQAIEEFQNEGYAVSNFSIMADTRKVPSSIENKTGVTAEEPSGDNQYQADQHQGFFESLLHPFADTTNGGGTTYYDHLVAEGISEADAKKYEEDINSGMILLLADNGPGNGADVSGNTLTRPANGTGVSGDVTTESMTGSQTNLDSGQETSSVSNRRTPDNF